MSKHQKIEFATSKNKITNEIKINIGDLTHHTKRKVKKHVKKEIQDLPIQEIQEFHNPYLDEVNMASDYTQQPIAQVEGMGDPFTRPAIPIEGLRDPIRPAEEYIGAEQRKYMPYTPETAKKQEDQPHEFQDVQGGNLYNPPAQAIFNEIPQTAYDIIRKQVERERQQYTAERHEVNPKPLHPIEGMQPINKPLTEKEKVPAMTDPLKPLIDEDNEELNAPMRQTNKPPSYKPPSYKPPSYEEPPKYNPTDEYEMDKKMEEIDKFINNDPELKKVVEDYEKEKTKPKKKDRTKYDTKLIKEEKEKEKKEIKRKPITEYFEEPLNVLSEKEKDALKRINKVILTHSPKKPPQEYLEGQITEVKPKKKPVILPKPKSKLKK